MNCLECRGACCESLLLPLYPDRGNRQLTEINRWLAVHGTVEKRTRSHDHVELEVRCTKLSPEGRCGIYEDRPLVCSIYPAGGEDCLTTVRKRRTPADYQRIRDAADPLYVHTSEIGGTT